MLYTYLISSHLSDARPVFMDGSTEYTYRGIDEVCGRIERALKRRGVSRNDRVVLLAEHTLNTVLILLSCMRMGACFVPVPPDISPTSLNVLTKSAAPALIIGSHSCGDRRMSVEELLKLSDGAAPSGPEEIPEDAICYILYTSGSTGTPHGVVALERNVRFCVDAINRRLRNTASDRILDCLPLSFDYGLYQIFLALASGACLVLPPSVPFPQIVSFLAKERITGFPSLPTMLNLLLKTRLLNKVTLNCLRYITSTGDVFPVDLIRGISDAIPSAEIIPMYGLTECKRVSVMPPNHLEKTFAGSCGLPLDGVSVRLEHVDSSGAGELIVSGENVMRGYWNDAEATERCFFLDSEKGPSLRTGDIFRIDSDGYLYFVGRKKMILKVNGYSIGIVELEGLLLSALGDIVQELAVIGYPDELCGEKIVVCAYTSATRDALEECLRRAVKSLSPYQSPHLLHYSALPLVKNANGKIDRTALKEKVLQDGYSSLCSLR